MGGQAKAFAWLGLDEAKLDVLVRNKFHEVHPSTGPRTEKSNDMLQKAKEP